MDNKFTQEQIELLAYKVKKGNISNDEWEIFNAWYTAHDDRIAYLPEDNLSADKLRTDMLHQIKINTGMRRRPAMAYMYTMLAAAVSVVILGVIAIPYINSSNSRELSGREAKLAIVPGRDQAVLTLTNGTKIALADAANGVLTTQQGIRLKKTANGQVVYEVDGKGGTKPGQFNTFETPRGGQFQINLPDGSKVWLNAASSIRFSPALATLKQRNIELRGEAYFEVRKDAARPFVVHTGRQDVEVLGTHFNISSYPDEPLVKTTLAEGRVRVANKGGKAVVLVPGQQAVNRSWGIQVLEVDVESELAWKNGQFISHGQDFKSMMRSIGRWYDVEIVFDHDPGNLHLGLQISRSRDIKDVIAVLERTGEVKLKIEGRRVHVIE